MNIFVTCKIKRSGPKCTTLMHLPTHPQPPKADPPANTSVLFLLSPNICTCSLLLSYPFTRSFMFSLSHVVNPWFSPLQFTIIYLASVGTPRATTMSVRPVLFFRVSSMKYTLNRPLTRLNVAGEYKVLPCKAFFKASK